MTKLAFIVAVVGVAIGIVLDEMGANALVFIMILYFAFSNIGINHYANLYNARTYIRSIGPAALIYTVFFAAYFAIHSIGYDLNMFPSLYMFTFAFVFVLFFLAVERYQALKR